jgi:hypothetical protein
MNLLQLSHHCIPVVVLHESHLGAFPLETVLSIDDVRPAFIPGKRNIANISVTIPTRSVYVDYRVFGCYFQHNSTTFQLVEALLLSADVKQTFK